MHFIRDLERANLSFKEDHGWGKLTISLLIADVAPM